MGPRLLLSWPILDWGPARALKERWHVCPRVCLYAAAARILRTPHIDQSRPRPHPFSIFCHPFKPLPGFMAPTPAITKLAAPARARAAGALSMQYGSVEEKPLKVRKYAACMNVCINNKQTRPGAGCRVSLVDRVEDR